MTGIWRLRAAILTLGGALVVHQGRYLLAPRGHDHELAHVHQYLAWLMPTTAVLVFLAVVQFGVWTTRTGDSKTPRLPSGGALWVAASASLLTAFGVQETLELTAVHGHLPALADLLGHGGWQVIPLAVAVGGVLALLLKGAASVVRWALRRQISGRRRQVRVLAWRDAVFAVRASVLARHLAGRAPPAL